MPVSMDLIKRVVIQGSSQGLDKLEGELKKIASSTDDVVVSFEKASRSQLSAEAGYKRLSSSIDPAYRAQQQIEKGTNTLNRAFQQGIISLDEYARRFSQLKEKYAEGASANDNYLRSMRQFQQLANEFANVKSDFGTESRRADIAAYGKALDDLRAKYNPLFAAGREYKQTLQDINNAAKVGAISERERAEAVARTKAAFAEQVTGLNQVTKAAVEYNNTSKLAKHELINLGRQVQDVVVSLQAGQSLLTVGLQQGTQVLDVFISSKGTFAGFAQQVLGFVARNPFAVMAGGIAAVGVAAVGAASYLNNYVKVLDDLSQSSGISAKDLSQLREAMAGKGIDSADFAAGINAIADKIAEAKKGTNELGQLFKLNGKAISDNVTNLYTLADLVKNAADYQDKKNILEAAGIPATAEAVRLYSQGAEELKKQKEATAGFGEDTKKLADSARAFDEAWNKAWESFKSAAVTNIAEVLAEIKKLASDPNSQAIMAFALSTPEQAYESWKGAAGRTIGRVKRWLSGGSFSDTYDAGIPADYEIPRPTQQYGPDLPTQTAKALKELIRVQQEHNSLMGESATAADKLALAELKIQQAVASGINLTDQEMKTIRANAVAVKEKAAAHDKVEEALRRANEGREEAIEKLKLEIKNMFMSAEAAKAEKIALEEIYKLKKAGVPEDRIPYDDIYANAKSRAAAKQQIEDLERVKDAIKSFKDAGVSIGTDFVKGMLAGKSAMDALGDAAVNAGKKLQDTGLINAITGLLSGNLAQAGLGAAQFGVGAALEWFGKSGEAAKEAQKAADELAKAQQKWADMASDFSSWIHDWTTGVSGELHSAIESARSQMQQFANAASAAHDPGGVASAQNAFNIGVSRSIGEALVALLAFGTETSSYSQKLKEAKDKAEDLRLTLIEFGTAAEEAALAVETRLAVAIERLKGQFLDDLVRKVNELAGGAWINQLTDLVDEVAQLRADAAALGIQTTLIDEYYVLAAQNIINENELVGSAFDAVATTLGPLGSQLHEFAAAAEEAAQVLKRSAQEIASTIQGYQDQLFIAQQDQQTLAGALAVFDLQAQRQREQEVAAGGEALVALEALQAQQRLNIIADFNNRALQEQQRADEERLRQQQQAAEEQQRIWDEATKFLQGALQNIQNWISSFLAGAQSPLSPQARLASAQSTFSTQYSAALGGDRDALSGITGNSQALVEAIRAVYGSTSAGQTLINDMLSQLQALPSTVSPEQFIVDHLTTAIDATTEAVGDMQAAIALALDTSNPSAIAQALSLYFNAIDSNTDGLLTGTELTAALGADYSSGVLHAIDQNGDGVISKAELINASLGGSSTTAGDNISGIDSNTSPLKTNTPSSPFNALIQSIVGEGGTNSFLSALLGNLGGVASNPGDDISAMRGLLSTTSSGWLGTISGQVGNYQTSISLIGELERIRSNLVKQNENWGAGWSPTPAQYLSPSAIPQFAYGGLVHGNPHSLGGRNINVEGGEYIVNKRDTARFRSQLDGINFGHRAPTANDNGVLISRINALLAEMKKNTNVSAAGAEHVRDGVDAIVGALAESARREKLTA